MNATQGHVRSPGCVARDGGFTLLELLVVIGILGLLLAAFLPDLLGAQKNAQEVETGATLQTIRVAIVAYEQRSNVYPPDDLVDPEGKLKLRPDNGTNTGVESLVVFLGQRRGGFDLAERPDLLANTDNDDNGATIPQLGHGKRMEIVDAWGTPLAYFCIVGAGFDKPQKILLAADLGGEVIARAWKSAEGSYLGGRKYQLISAGPDRAFNTDDDVTWPER